MVVYSKDGNIDGHPITKDGVPLSKQQIIDELNSLANCIAHLKDVLWQENARTNKASDSMIIAMEVATDHIGNT